MVRFLVPSCWPTCLCVCVCVCVVNVWEGIEAFVVKNI